MLRTIIILPAYTTTLPSLRPLHHLLLQQYRYYPVKRQRNVQL